MGSVAISHLPIFLRYGEWHSWPDSTLVSVILLTFCIMMGNDPGRANTLAYNIVDNETVYKGHIFDVLERTISTPEHGKTMQREIVHLHDNAVAFAVVDADGFVALNDEYRAGINRVIESIPAGKLNDGESPLMAVKREIREELGLVLPAETVFEEIATVNSSEGFTDEQVTVFVVRVNLPHNRLADVGQQLDETEYVTIKWLPLTDAQKRLIAGAHSAPAIIAMLALK
jgi:ADP-ribose pyrophosphatase